MLVVMYPPPPHHPQSRVGVCRIWVCDLPNKSRSLHRQFFFLSQTALSGRGPSPAPYVNNGRWGGDANPWEGSPAPYVNNGRWGGDANPWEGSPAPLRQQRWVRGGC